MSFDFRRFVIVSSRPTGPCVALHATPRTSKSRKPVCRLYTEHDRREYATRATASLPLFFAPHGHQRAPAFGHVASPPRCALDIP